MECPESVRSLFLALIFSVTRMPCFSTVNVCRSDVLGPILGGPRTGISKGLGPVLPSVAEPRHAHQHHDLHPDRVVHVVPEISSPEDGTHGPDDLHVRLSSLDTHYSCLHGHVGLSGLGRFEPSHEDSVLHFVVGTFSFFVYTGRAIEPKILETRVIREWR